MGGNNIQTREEIKEEYSKKIQKKLDKKIYDVIEIENNIYIIDPEINHVYNIENELLGIKYKEKIIFFKEIDEIIKKSNELSIN